MKTLFPVLALAASFVAAGASAAPAEQRFTRAGVTYVYTVTDASGGRRVIEGRRFPGNSAFRLVVNGKRVNGMADGYPVSFRTPAVAGPPVEVAAR
jgi:hypothetical protein